MIVIVVAAVAAVAAVVNVGVACINQEGISKSCNSQLRLNGSIGFKFFFLDCNRKERAKKFSMR